MAGNDVETVIWYRPRVRLWRDRTNEWHLAGEPDGVAKIVSAFRRVARGADDSVDVELRTDAIPERRNPVEERGVAQMFERLTLEQILSRRGSEVPIRITSVRANVRVEFSHRTKHLLGYALLELLDGEGDFSLEVHDESGRATRLWFWGYSNPHGIDGF